MTHVREAVEDRHHLNADDLARVEASAPVWYQSRSTPDL
jgi:hypothetical protein